MFRRETVHSHFFYPFPPLFSCALSSSGRRCTVANRFALPTSANLSIVSLLLVVSDAGSSGGAETQGAERRQMGEDKAKKIEEKDKIFNNLTVYSYNERK